MHRFYNGAWLPFFLLLFSLHSAANEERVDWPSYAGSASGKQFSALDQVNRDNVGQLQLLWQYKFPPAAAELDELTMQM